VDQIGQSMYLKQGVLDISILENMIDKYAAQSSYTNSSNLLNGNTNTLLDYIFDEVITSDNIDLARLSSFDYNNPNIYNAQLTDKSLAALLDATITKALLVANESDQIDFDYSIDSLQITDIILDKSMYYIDGEPKMVTRMYTSLGLGKSDFVDLVTQNIDNQSGRKIIKSALDIFMPDTIYFEALIGLSDEIPVQIGFNNVRIGERYTRLKDTIKGLSNNIKGIETIDLDEYISKPVNDYVIPLIKGLQPYAALEDVANGTFKMDIMGLLLNISGINNEEETVWFEPKDIALSLKAVFGNKPQEGTNEYQNWYYQVDKNGKVVLEDQNPIKYKAYSQSFINDYKTKFAQDTALQYRLDIKKPSYNDDKDVYKYNTDYTNIDEMQNLEGVDWTQTFNDLMAFFVGSAKGDSEFYVEQFKPLALINRFLDLLDGIDITDQQAVTDAINQLMQKLILKLDGGVLFAIVSDQFDSLFDTPQLQSLQIKLESVALKQINVFDEATQQDVVHNTLLFGLSITPQQVQGSQGSFVNKILSKVYVATEIDITLTSDPNFERLSPFLALNSLDYQESNILLNIFSRFDTGININYFDPIAQNMNLIFDKIGAVNEFLQIDINPEIA